MTENLGKLIQIAALAPVSDLWVQAKGHYFGTTKVDIAAGTELTVFIDKPEAPAAAA